MASRTPFWHALVLLGAGSVGGLLADVDHPRSLAGRWFWFWPKLHEGRWPHERWGRWTPFGEVWHRQQNHSIAAGLLWASLGGGIALWVSGFDTLMAVTVWLGLQLGYLSHLLIDSLQPTPQMLGWPFTRRLMRLRWLPAVREASLLGRVIDDAMCGLAVIGVAWVYGTGVI